MAEALELVAQLREVVDLACIDEGGDCPPLFLRLPRLRTPREVDDGEAAMPQTDMAGDENTARVWTAERHRFRHRRHDVALCPEIALVAHPTSYSAHRGSPRRPFTGTGAHSCIASTIESRSQAVPPGAWPNR